jgi:acyl-CoA synthetase (AMP-forming)/AMP-acid ligase II
MPRATLDRLRQLLPHAKTFLMYGLTEAFRSTYLPPTEVDRRPDSIGKAIPNAEIVVVDRNGRPCKPEEEGELVHRGALVSLGYWNDPERTAERFRPAPGQLPQLCLPEIAVWSGDIVKMDSEGYLYFIGRRDDMIKTSGNRISPTEIEEVVYDTGLAAEVAVVGAPHPALGQGIVLFVVPRQGRQVDAEALTAACRTHLPAFMVPHAVIPRLDLPRNANGKIDRASLRSEIAHIFEEEPAA